MTLPSAYFAFFSAYSWTVLIVIKWQMKCNETRIAGHYDVHIQGSRIINDEQNQGSLLINDAQYKCSRVINAVQNQGLRVINDVQNQE